MFGNFEKMPRQTNTKEKIISSAFLMYRKRLFKEFSLSDVAKASGISKTAIFRHFENKAELVSTMDERLFEAFEVLAKNIQDESNKRTLESTRNAVDLICEFDKENPGYIEYYIQAMMCNKKETSSKVMEIMSNNHLNLPKEEIFKDEKALLPENLIPLYMEITILIFLVEGGRASDSGVMQDGGEKFRKKLTDIIFEGLGKEEKPVSEKRRKELDVLCKMNLAKDENQDRFLDAFVKVLHKKGGLNFTVEDIANELGMAKSSIYSFFESKTDYMKNMLKQETDFFGEVLQEKCTLASNAEEMVYILMRSGANYFSKRPQLVFMHIFFNQYESENFEEEIPDNDNDFLSKILPPNFDLGLSNSKLAFVRWISILVITFTFMGKKHDLPLAWNDFFISTVFEFIECGIKSCIKNRMYGE